MISCHNISKQYDEVQALKNVSITCNRGEILGLVGANGAGKTTLFKILLGLSTPDSGTVKITGEGTKKVGGIIEKPALYPYLNALENLRVFAKMQGANASSATLNSFLHQVGLSLDRLDPVRKYSMGMKQRLGIAVALLNNPSCLLLDEPFSGLDPLGIQALKKLIIRLAKNNKMAILISSHIIEVLSTLCTDLYVIRNGVMVQNGPTTKMLAACTKGFTICGTELQNTSLLDEYAIVNNGNCVTVFVSPTEISEIIFRLSNQGIAITSCTPELDVQLLFNPDNS
jgi:ABC-2 type transport system ATP-binding protein